MGFDITNPQIHDHFNSLIQRHNHLMKLARKLADAISFVSLVQLFISSLVLCIMGMYIVINNFYALYNNRKNVFQDFN
jgi:hypothetical protein